MYCSLPSYLRQNGKIQHVVNPQTEEPLNLRSGPRSTITYILLSRLMETGFNAALSNPWMK